MCTPACSCISLHTLPYWTLQTEILWAEFNELKWSLLTSQWKQPSAVDSSRLSASSVLKFVGHSASTVYRGTLDVSIFLHPRFIAEFRARQAAEGDSPTQWCSHSKVEVLRGDPLWCCSYTVSSSQQQYWFTLQPWACCHRQYITLFNLLLNRL